MKSWAFGAMVVSMFAIAACGSKGTTGTTTGDSAGGSGGTGGAGTTGSNTTGSNTTGSNTTGSNTTATSSTGAGDTCADGSDCTVCPAPSATDDTCPKCCDIATPNGLSTYNNLFVKSCACAAMSKCHTDCGVNGADPDFCADMTKQPSQACVACLNTIMQADACVMSFATECKKSADCVAFAQCAQGCAG